MVALVISDSKSIMNPSSKQAVKSHIACPACGSSDALTLYADGHTTCYSCKAHPVLEGTLPVVSQDYEKIHKIRPLPEVYHDLADRKIKAATAKKFQVTVVQDEKSPWKYIYPYFDRENLNDHIANKKRAKLKKDFIWEGEVKRAALFGQQLFPKGGKYLTIVEGQDDAMAAYEMFGGRGGAVSVHGASSAVQDCVDNFEYLNSFENIVICFDKDEAKVHPTTGEIRYPGQEAALAVAALFPIGKVKILTLQEGKDANDYKINGWDEKFQKEWWAAEKYTPTGIKLGKDMWTEISTPRKYETIPYPWDSANKMLYGLRLSEVVLLTADTGIGKTQIVKELEHHVLTTTDKGVGFLHLEEPNADTALGIMSVSANKPLHLPDVREGVGEDELRKYYDAVINNDRVVIWDHFGSNSVHEVLAKIRHMHNLGCKYIFLDHLSIIVSDQSGDERKQLDEISTKLKQICMELNICVIAVIHQNRAGMVRGSAGPEQIANAVIKLHRDKMDPDEWRRNVTKMVLEKNRFAGRSGPMTYLWYNDFTGRLEEMSKEDIGKFEAGGTAEVKEGW